MRNNIWCFQDLLLLCSDCSTGHDSSFTIDEVLRSRNRPNHEFSLYNYSIEKNLILSHYLKTLHIFFNISPLCLQCSTAVLKLYFNKKYFIFYHIFLVTITTIHSISQPIFLSAFKVLCVIPYYWGKVNKAQFILLSSLSAREEHN